MNNKSPLRYPGGKTRACKIIDEIINKYFDIKNIKTIISPFFGGGSIEFFLSNKYNYEIIANDKFTPLYNFWNQIKINKEKICDELRKNLNINKDDFINYRKIILNSNEYEQAIYYFIINRCSFNGSTLSGGFSLESSKKRFTESSIDRIEKLNLSNFKFYNKDFIDFLNDIDFTNSIIFLDPPYYINSKLYGNNGDLHEFFDHEKLFITIKDKKNWIMTYNNCNYIRNLYKEFIILDAKWSYCMNNSKESSEIIILSL
jgi:DNA adenine methylase